MRRFKALLYCETLAMKRLSFTRAAPSVHLFAELD